MKIWRDSPDLWMNLKGNMFLLTCGHRGVILVERNILTCKNWKRNLKDKMSCLWAFPVIMSCGDGKGPWKTGKCRESSGGLEMILLS